MPSSQDRREFLKTILKTTGAALVAGAAGPACARKSTGRGTVPAPSFYWGVGIENCWIAQTDPVKDGNRRLLDVFQQMQHYEKWKEDLDLVKDIGFNSIRYSVPWYKAEPKPGVYDWSWIDKPVRYLVETLKIVPIMDLIHYGTPAWMADGVIDDRFPDSIARYAEAMAAHFKGLVSHYSPHNEPGLTCLFCGLVGRWPPYHKSIDSWAKIGVRVARGMLLEMEAIRRVLADAVIVSVDPFFYEVIDPHLPPAPAGDPARKELLRAAAFYPASLAYGKLTDGHPLAEFLLGHGIPEADLAWFRANARKPDILGCNLYPGISLSPLGGPAADVAGQNLAAAAQIAAEAVGDAIIDSQTYFGLPVYMTETSAGKTDDAKIAYIQALQAMIQDLRAKNVPIVGLNWWPLFETIQWDYRENPDKPLTDFIYPGGWNNGLYRIQAETGGDLKRVRTPAAGAYAEMLAEERNRK
jgi:beta-glucosidase